MSSEYCNSRQSVAVFCHFPDGKTDSHHVCNTSSARTSTDEHIYPSPFSWFRHEFDKKSNLNFAVSTSFRIFAASKQT